MADHYVGRLEFKHLLQLLDEERKHPGYESVSTLAIETLARLADEKLEEVNVSELELALFRRMFQREGEKAEDWSDDFLSFVLKFPPLHVPGRIEFYRRMKGWDNEELCRRLSDPRMEPYCRDEIWRQLDPIKRPRSLQEECHTFVSFIESASFDEVWRRLEGGNRNALLCVKILFHNDDDARKELVKICLRSLGSLGRIGARSTGADGTGTKHDDWESFINAKIGEELAAFADRPGDEILREALCGQKFGYLPHRVYSRAIDELRRPGLYVLAPGDGKRGGQDQADNGLTVEEWLEWQSHHTAAAPDVVRDIGEWVSQYGNEITAACGKYGIEVLKWWKSDLEEYGDDTWRARKGRMTRFIASLVGVEARQARAIKQHFIGGLKNLPFASELASSLNPYCGPGQFPAVGLRSILRGAGAEEKTINLFIEGMNSKPVR
jgi:hypothetical protein